MKTPAITAVRLGTSSGSVQTKGINKEVGEEVVEAEAMEASVSKTPTLPPIPPRILPLGNLVQQMLFFILFVRAFFFIIFAPRYGGLI